MKGKFKFQNYEKKVFNSEAHKKLITRNRGVKLILIILIILLVYLGFSVSKKIIKTENEELNPELDPELARAMTYEQVKPGDEVTNSECVTFDAFFLRDLDGDGYSDGIRGTCKEISQTDTLYMEINVKTAGELRNAEITIDGKNFNLQTVLVKDSQLKDDYVGNDIKNIEFNTLYNGTQKLLTGVVNANIKSNINNYSRNDNKVILTGDYIDEEGRSIQIKKEVLLSVDWYGTIEAGIATQQQIYSLENAVIDEENETISFKVDLGAFSYGNLLGKKFYLEGDVIELNGYLPLDVTAEKEENLVYDKASGKFVIEKNQIIDENGYVKGYTDGLNGIYREKINIIYPLKAYTDSENMDTIQVNINLKVYFEGYNNPNEEFENPYKSNTKVATIIANFERNFGEVAQVYIKFKDLVKNYYTDRSEYVVYKDKPMKLYTGQSEAEIDDRYAVRWNVKARVNQNKSGFILKEGVNNSLEYRGDVLVKNDSTRISMENLCSNVGIYFEDNVDFIKDDGWVKIYDNDTNEMLVMFTKEDITKYSENNPYFYSLPVKHIRIETSEVKENEWLIAYNIKEIDDDYIINNYTKEEFDNFKYIESRIEAYLGDIYLKMDIATAKYVSSYSDTGIAMRKTNFSTQEVSRNTKIEIITGKIDGAGLKWRNGKFLIKLPEELIDVKINNITILNKNVKITNYELIDKTGTKFIKIDTENDIPEEYELIIDVDMTPNPKLVTTSSNIELYATNDMITEYLNSSEDIYDVNNNLNYAEKVSFDTEEVSFIAPSSLLTGQSISNYDNKGSIIYAPAIGDVKPTYAGIDGKENTADIGFWVVNNYMSTISEVMILGKIPYTGSSNVGSGNDLESSFDVEMVNTGIQIPDALNGKISIYYSDIINPDKDLNKAENNWKTEDSIGDWSKVKNFLICFNDEMLSVGDKYEFKYTIKMPKGVEFNKISYSHHGVYFSLDTDQGKYKTYTEPSKLGIKIAEKYNVELTKYQTGKNKVVGGALYKIVDEETSEARTFLTNTEGKIEIENLYAEKVYKLEEIRAPENYKLNSEVIRFIGHVDESGNLTIEKLSGNVRKEFEIVKNDDDVYKATVDTEDEVKASLNIVKYEKETELKLKGVRYRVTGIGIPNNSIVLATDLNGETFLNGLEINTEYTIEEISAEGYYLNDPVKFKILNNNGIYQIEILEGVIKSSAVINQDDIPLARLEFENEKKPRYNLQIIKTKKTIESVNDEGELNTDNAEIMYLEGAKFRLYKNNKKIGEYETDSEGKFTIENLYQYIDGKDEDAVYILKEVISPEGFSKAKDIKFKVENKDENLVFINIEGDIEDYIVEGNLVKLQIEDPPVFKLIKKDDETNSPIANVKFAIYNIDNEEVPAVDCKGEILGEKEIINGNEYYVVSTDINGEILADLPEGVYKAVELEAPEQYDITDCVYYFGIAKREPGDIEYRSGYGNIINTGITTIEATEDGGYIAGTASRIIKYNSIDELEWYTETSKQVNVIKQTTDGGYVVGSDTLIKYNSNGQLEWKKDLNVNEIKSVTQTTDGGYIIGSISSNIDPYSAYVIKCTYDGQIEWRKAIAKSKGSPYGGFNEINCVIQTKDGGYVVAGTTYCYCIDYGDGNIIYNNSYDEYMPDWHYYPRGIIVEYDSFGNVVRGRLLENYNTSKLNSVAELENGDLVVCGTDTSYGLSRGFADVAGKYYNNGYLWENCGPINEVEATADGGNIICGTDYYGNGMLVKFNSEYEKEWSKNILGSKNSILSLCQDNENNYIVGGTCTGDITLDDGTNIIGNGSTGGMIVKFYGHEVSGTGIEETQELIVRNIRKEFKITTEVNKIDGIKGGTISGEDEEAYEVVKYGDSNIKEIKMIPNENYEIIGITINDEEYPFEANEDGTFTMPQLTNVTEDKHIVVTYSLKDNKITINKVDSITKASLTGARFKLDQIEERTKPENVIGELTDNGQEYSIANTEKEVTGVLGELTNNGTYYFIEQDEKYVPTNSKTYQVADGGTEGLHNTTANSYIPIDLSSKTGKFAVVVNANISSESRYDYGYATITETVSAPTYSDSTGQFVYLSGTVSATDYTSMVLEGGKTYYLHLGYRKDSVGDSGTDQIEFNSIKVCEVTNITYKFVKNEEKYESNNQGKDNTVANSYIPIDLTSYTGKYNLVVNAEISSQSSDYGYVSVTENTTRPSYSSSTGRFVYISGTNSAKDYQTVLQGGKMYYLHLGYYKNGSISQGDDKFTINNIDVTLNNSELYYTEVETNSEGKAITQIPFGKYKVTEVKAPKGYLINENLGDIEFVSSGNHEFTFENVKESKVIVHHYLKDVDGNYTTTEVFDTEYIVGKESDSYTTAPNLNLEQYELEKDSNNKYVIPENAAGIFTKEDIIVNYYYEVRNIPLIVHHYINGTITPVPLSNGEVAEDVINYGNINDEYTTESISSENLDSNYELVSTPWNASGRYEGDEVVVTYYYRLKATSVLVHHYIEGTENKLSEDVVINGKVNDEYITEVATDIPEQYELVEQPENNTGIMTLEQVVVTYYYRLKQYGYVVNYLEKDTNTVLHEQKQGQEYTYGTEIDANAEKIEIDGYKFDSIDKDSLTITNGENVINIYYVKRNDLSYKVNYLEKDTDKVLSAQKVQENMIFESVITSGDEVIEIDGYNFDSVDKDSLTITTGENVINIYYVKRNDLSYKVNHLEKDTNKVLSAQKVQNGMIFEDVITSSNEVIEIDGYNYDSVDKDSLTITTGENVINIYYTKRNDLSYKVNYLEKDTDKVLSTQKVVNGMTLEDVVIASNEVIEIDGYNYDSVDKDELVITTGENVINIYYTKRNDLSYKVNYLEKDTNKVINEQKVVNGMTFEDVVTAEDEVIEIDGYNYDSVDKDELVITIGENVINIYYTKRNDLSYTVNYLEKDTNKVLKDQKVQDGMTFEDIIISADEVVSIYGYNFDSADKETLTIGTSQNVINLYYTKKDTSVLVHHYAEGTEVKVAEDVTIAGKVGDDYETTVAEDLPSKYELVVEPMNKVGQMTEEQIVVIYYYKVKTTKVIVHHYEEGTTNKLSENIEIEGLIESDYTTEAATDIPSKYELVKVPENATGVMTEEVIEVTYFYKVRDAVLNIYYLEKGTDIELAKPEKQTGKVEENYRTDAKVIDGYTLVEHSGNTVGQLQVEPLTVIYYYLKNTRATVQYIDITTGEILEERTDEGLVGDEFATETKTFEDYILVREPEEKVVTMTKDEIVLKYYYLHVSAGVIEQHIDITTGDVLYNDIHSGNEGDEYNIPSRSFVGYDLVEDRLPVNAEGRMTVDPITVTYYYIHKAKVTAKYIDKTTGEKLTEDVVEDGHEGDSYTTENKTFEGYKLVQVPENSNGTMTKEDIIVTYYYVPKSAGVIERHLDVLTNEPLVPEKIYTGYAEDPYETTEQKIPSYDLVKEKYPENAKGTMTKDEIVVTYYYSKKTQVKVKYVDKITGQEIAEPDVIDGHQGDEYTTEEKEILGYDLVEVPENKNGTMTEDVTEVIYYYIKPAKVIANYYDIDTKETIAAEEVIEGHESDKYETAQKEIKYYNLVEVSGNQTGNMTSGDTRVDYYYKKKVFNLKIEKQVKEIAYDDKVLSINGDIGKLEINKKRLTTTDVLVTYEIRVMNTGELKGGAELIENIPNGMTMSEAENKGWVIHEDTAILSIDNIEPKQEEAYTVVMRWTPSEENIGLKENIAQIVKTENEAGFEEISIEDNEDKADFVISIQTGLEESSDIIKIAIIAIYAILGITVAFIIKKEHKK